MLQLLHVLDPADFVEIITQLLFTEKSSVGNSTCTDIQILNDNILESDETFMIILTALDNSTSIVTTASSSALIVILEDNDDCKFKQSIVTY